MEEEGAPLGAKRPAQGHTYTPRGALDTAVSDPTPPHLQMRRYRPQTHRWNPTPTSDLRWASWERLSGQRPSLRLEASLPFRVGDVRLLAVPRALSRSRRPSPRALQAAPVPQPGDTAPWALGRPRGWTSALFLEISSSLGRATRPF